MDDVAAVVLTHLRPRLATATVRRLIDEQGLSPERILVVVNGEGGLEPDDAVQAVPVLRLAANYGPSGGFERGLRQVFADPSVAWAYVCEDDVGLLDIPAGRVRRVLAEVADYERADTARRVGAVVAYGRRFGGQPGETLPYVPTPSPALQPVDLAAWGATLIRRDVGEAGVWPDEELFFGFEDFDYYLRMREAGLEVLVDADTGRAVAHQMTLEGRDAALADHRPPDTTEAWRAFYVARNYVAYARRHGTRSWLAWHVLRSARRFQRASSWASRRATAHGLVLGFRGKLGLDPRYVRAVGEWSEPKP